MAATMTSADYLTKRQRLELVLAQLKIDRSSFETQWRDLADHLCPTRPNFMGVSDRNQGGRKNQKIIDETGVYALDTLAAGLHAGMTNPAHPWFKLGVADPDLSKFGPVKEWLFEVEQRIYQVLQLSNLYHKLLVVYSDMAAFGTAAVGMLEDDEDLFSFYDYPVGSYWLGCDRRRLATTFVTEYALTIWQLIEEFGGPDGSRWTGQGQPDLSRFSPAVRRLIDTGKYEATVDLCWYVTPNRGDDEYAIGAKGYPWSSCHYEKGQNTGQYLRESGFQEFPIMGPRWLVNGNDTYGTKCPGMVTIGAVRQLQVMQKRADQAIEKQINPPMQASTELRTQKVSQIPGDITFVSSFERGGAKPIYEIKPDVTGMERRIYNVQARINRGFYVDLFQMLTQMDESGSVQPRTAREIEERHQEKLVVLGPVLDSTGRELLRPIIGRAFSMLQRAGGIPPAPPDVQGAELIPEFVSILAQARKMAAIGLNEGFVATLLPLAKADPTVLDVLDDVEYAREQGDNFGVNPKILRDPETVAKIRAGRAQAAQQQAQAEQMAAGAQSAKALSQTPMDGDTALTRLVGGLTG